MKQARFIFTFALFDDFERIGDEKSIESRKFEVVCLTDVFVLQTYI